MNKTTFNRNSDSIIDIKWLNYGKKTNNNKNDYDELIDKFRQLKTRQVNLFEYGKSFITG
jgi:hypothetical protein